MTTKITESLSKRYAIAIQTGNHEEAQRIHDEIYEKNFDYYLILRLFRDSGGDSYLENEGMERQIENLEIHLGDLLNVALKNKRKLFGDSK